MEGTHCTLQLHNPITELCYISFYLPKGEVRGFSYKGTVTLDRFNNAFHNCYQVREGPDITSLSQQPNEHPGDIFFKQTPTKDILTELYKLTAERERLLDSLLRSDHILGISMGSQEGKLQELTVSLASEDDCFHSAGNWSRELPVSSLIRRSTQGSKKPRRSGRRRDSPEELRQKRNRRKGRGRQESAQMGKDQVCSSSSLSPSRARPNLRLLEERGNLVPQGTLTSSLRRRDSCPANILRTSDADLGFRNSGRTSEDTDLEGPLSPDSSPTEVGGAGVGGQLRSPHEQEPPQPSLPENHEKHPGVARWGGRTWKSKSLERTCRKKPVSKVVAKVQELSAPVQRVVRAHPDSEGRVAFCPQTQTEFIPKADFLALPGTEAEHHSLRRLEEEQQGVKTLQPSATERASIVREPGSSTQGAVNKVLRKVIESEKLDEATEGKRLGFSLNTRATFPETSSQTKAALPQSGHKFLLLDLPHTVGPDSSKSKCSEKKPTPQAPTALGMVFNNSSPQPSAHKRLSPVPSPLSPRCPSPQQHHRILLLPPLPSEGEAVFNEYPSRKNSISSGFSSTNILEPSSSTQVTETKGASPTSLRASQSWLVSEEPSEKSLGPEKITAPSKHQVPPG